MSTEQSSYEKRFRAQWMTDAQWRCTEVAAALRHGFHHVHELQACGHGIQFWEPNEIATFDGETMTRAVLLAHQHGVRIGASARTIMENFEGDEYSTTKMIITIHPRVHDDSASRAKRHPDLQSLIDAARERQP